MNGDYLADETSAHDPQRQREVLGRVVEALAARRLTAPAIFVLESVRPLSYIASQALVFFQPIVQGLLGVGDYHVFAAALENRENIEWLVNELEAAEERGTCMNGGE